MRNVLQLFLAVVTIAVCWGNPVTFVHIKTKLTRTSLNNEFKSGSPDPWIATSPTSVYWNLEDFPTPTEDPPPTPSTGTKCLRATRDSQLTPGLLGLHTLTFTVPVNLAEVLDSIQVHLWQHTRRMINKSHNYFQIRDIDCINDDPPISSSSPRTTTPSDLVERWVHLQREMNHTSTSESSPVHRIRPIVKSSSRRTRSAISSYRQPVESLTVSFASLLVDQINGAPSKPTSATYSSKRGKNNKKKIKKKTQTTNPAVKITIRNNKPVNEIDHVEEWLQQRSAHYAWWRKFVPSSTCNPTVVTFNRPSTCPDRKNLNVNHSQPKQPKAPRCVLWFQFTGNPSKPRPGSCNKTAIPSAGGRMHNIRIEQQPLGGANALVFAADLHIGEDFAIVSRRQPGFTFSLTFFIDGVRHARLSGCCENARNLHVPTRVGGPIGAFVLRTVQGGEPCQICEKSVPFADPELFTVWPKSHSRQLMNSSQECGIDRIHENQPTRKRSSLRRTKPALDSNSPVTMVTVSNQSVDDEQPSSDVLGPGFTSTEDTYEEQFYSDVIAPSIEGQEQQSYEFTATCSQSEVYEEQVSSDLFIPFGSVSIEEVFSIGSPLRTPHSSPGSFTALDAD
ncbi:hypothetical protein GHT06_016349 [Daphnia sinensis]|uniref:DUF4590 domain-containing protein n=1 Tax=Daphnia sinensis TaxID=1820382 RepID=A0AAD5PTW4_9CRUS|nr:hypothetical protein GHT06_016349 [Daphnia sinensis]